MKLYATNTNPIKSIPPAINLYPENFYSSVVLTTGDQRIIASE